MLLWYNWEEFNSHQANTRWEESSMQISCQFRPGLWQTTGHIKESLAPAYQCWHRGKRGIITGYWSHSETQSKADSPRHAKNKNKGAVCRHSCMVPEWAWDPLLGLAPCEVDRFVVSASNNFLGWFKADLLIVDFCVKWSTILHF